MSKKKLVYLVSQPFVNCQVLSDNQICKLLGSIEKERILLEDANARLINMREYLSVTYVTNHDRLLHYYQDTTTLIELLKENSSISLKK